MVNQSKPASFSGEAAIHSYLQLLARYERLNEISQKLNSTLDLRALLNMILDAARELTNTEQASILLIDESSGELRFEAASNLSPGAMEAFVVPIDNSFAGWIVTHNEPVLVEDAQSDHRLYRVVDNTMQSATRNLLGVPMSAKGKVIGVVETINKRGDASWTEDDVDALRALAAQAAIAIVNARLFQQNDFISEIVHELRTPLAALKASTALLLRPDLPEKRRGEIVVTMQEETDRLAQLASDFLDLARLESGRAKLETARFSIVPLINESVEIVQYQAKEHGVTIAVEGDPALTLEGDRGKTKQVLLNLLTNAIKYNRDNGHIFVSVALEPVDEDDGFDTDAPPRLARIAVRDTGVGISKENLAHLFEKFYRIADTAGYTQGTGLGLVIAKKIVEAQGGQMHVDSEMGEGTTFTFTVPLATPSAESTPRTPTA
jgi:signal transduction histidine kinase